MSAPTIGITILIVLGFATFFQLLIQGIEHKKNYKELQERLDKIESNLGQ